jgi:hypothetical protein
MKDLLPNTDQHQIQTSFGTIKVSHRGLAAQKRKIKALNASNGQILAQTLQSSSARLDPIPPSTASPSRQAVSSRPRGRRASTSLQLAPVATHRPARRRYKLETREPKHTPVISAPYDKGKEELPSAYFPSEQLPTHPQATVEQQQGTLLSRLVPPDAFQPIPISSASLEACCVDIVDIEFDVHMLTSRPIHHGTIQESQILAHAIFSACSLTGQHSTRKRGDEANISLELMCVQECSSVESGDTARPRWDTGGTGFRSGSGRKNQRTSDTADTFIGTRANKAIKRATAFQQSRSQQDLGSGHKGDSVGSVQLSK